MPNHCHQQTSILLAAFLLDSIASQSSPATPRVVPVRGKSDGRGYQGTKAGLGYKGKVMQGAAEGFGVLDR